MHFELTPNCLLTRWPVLFVPGQRSLFYYKNYWNLFPEFLAEHGYEVFHLNLPWQNRELQKQKLNQFWQQNSAPKKLHLVLTRPDWLELKENLDQHADRIASITVMMGPQDKPVPGSFKIPLYEVKIPQVAGQKNSLKLALFQLHRLRLWPSPQPEPIALGLHAPLESSQILLHHLQTLAERDLLTT